MMNYTEGPWTWENYHDTHTALIRIANLKPGDKRTVLFHAAAWEILPADKNLIQAAPEMYEALKAIGQCCLVTEYSAEERIRLIEQSVNVALGKAEGRL